MEARATAVEVDVRKTKVGKLVILHDATLDRTTEFTRRIESRRIQPFNLHGVG